MDVEVSSDSKRFASEAAGRSILPAPQYHWYIARGLLRWSRAGRTGRPLYEERLVLIDAPTPAKAVDVARQEAKQGCLRGQKSVGVIDLILLPRPGPGADPGHGHELCRSVYRSIGSPEKFVERRFASGVWHALKGRAKISRKAGADPTDPDWDPGLVVVRSLYRSERLRLAGGKPCYLWIERFSVFQTNDCDQALQWAETDDEALAHVSGFENYPLWEAFRLWGPLGDKAELFSILRESQKSPRAFSRQISSNTV